MFELAAVHAYAARYGFTPAIHTAHECGGIDVFQRYPRITGTPDAFFKVDDPWPVYTEFVPPPATATTVCLNGFFQSERHFHPGFLSTLMFPFVLPIVNACFVHVRRGDYLGDRALAVHLEMYFPSALDFVRKRHPGVQFRVFSDDIPWCKSRDYFATDDVAFETETNPVCAMATMAACVVGGICANSTFSWWGAYMNPHPDKTVVFPSKWMNDYPCGDDIYFQNSWILSVDGSGTVRRKV